MPKIHYEGCLHKEFHVQTSKKCPVKQVMYFSTFAKHGFICSHSFSRPALVTSTVNAFSSVMAGVDEVEKKKAIEEEKERLAALKVSHGYGDIVWGQYIELCCCVSIPVMIYKHTC